MIGIMTPVGNFSAQSVEMNFDVYLHAKNKLNL